MTVLAGSAERHDQVFSVSSPDNQLICLVFTR